MKRSAMPRSSKPLRSKSPLRRSQPSTEPRQHWISGKQGKKKRAEQLRRKQVREIVFDRVGRRCELAGIEGAGPCFGVLTFHHKLKASQGGGYTVENGACLCAHHNCELEANARLAGIARSMRLVVLSWEQER